MGFLTFTPDSFLYSFHLLIVAFYNNSSYKFSFLKILTGGGEAPRALSGRLIAATWWLFGFIVIATYTANLAAFLTVSRMDEPIKSLDDLSSQYQVQYAPMNGSKILGK